MDTKEMQEENKTVAESYGHPKSVYKKILAWLGWTFVVVYFLFLGLVLVLRFYALPYLESQKTLIENKASELLGTPLTIERIFSSWDFFTPVITLKNVQLGIETPLKVQELVLVPSYLSVIKLTPIFSSISVIGPELFIERTGQLRFNTIGKEFDFSNSAKNIAQNQSDFDPSTVELLFEQKKIGLKNGTIHYTDNSEHKSLQLKQIDFVLDNSLLNKQAALDFVPPEDISTPVSVKADFSVPLSASFKGIAGWNELIYLSVEKVNFGEVAKWAPDFQFKYKGVGSGKLWLNLVQWKPASATFIGALSDLNLSFDPKLPPLLLNYFKGKVSGEIGKSFYKVSTDQVAFEFGSGITAPSFTASLELNTNNQNTIIGGTIKADSVNIKGFAEAFPSLPIPEDLKKFIVDRKLNGILKNVTANWSGDSSTPSSYNASLRFENVSSQSYVAPGKGKLWLPGINNLSGSVEINNQKGKVSLNSTNSSIALPGLFDAASFHFDSLELNGDWDIKDKYFFNVDLLQIENNDLAFKGHGSYDSTQGEYGFVKAYGQLLRGKVASVWKYVPLIAGKETVAWLKYGLLGGNITNGVLEFSGPLHEFPYKDTELHKFTVDAVFENGVIDFYPVKFDNPNAKNKPGAIWPTVEGVGGKIYFHGDGLKATVDKGHYGDVNVGLAIVEIPSFTDDSVVLTVDADAHGPIPTYLKYVNTSPIKGYTADIFGKAKGKGNGDLDLELTVPLDSHSEVAVNGFFAVNGAEIQFNQYQIPDLTNVVGKVFFNEKGARAQNLSAKTFGENVTAEFNTTDKGVFMLTTSGRIPAQALKQVIPVESLAHLSTKYIKGIAPFSLKGEITSDKVGLNITSSLEGLAINLPAPFNKPAAKKDPLKLDVSVKNSDVNVDLTLGNIFDGKFALRNDQLVAASISNGDAAPIPKNGFVINFATPVLSVAKWTEVLKSLPQEKPKLDKHHEEIVEVPLINSVNINIGELLIDNFNQNKFKLVGRQVETGWHAHIESSELTGDLAWNKARNGKEAELQAYFSKLYIPDSAGEFAQDTKPVQVQGGWPAINAMVENFIYGSKKLGKIELKARNTLSRQGHLWQIQKLNITNSDATLASSGSWLKSFDNKNTTTLLLDTKITNLGGLLTRFGLAKVIKNGRGSVKGELSWTGTPLGYNPNTFDGKLSIDLRKGEILKIEPGAAKLLTLLSLQSLTRYLTLDFRDFFSKGLNFDSIIGKTNMENGLMRINDLTMVGSGATVITNGLVNVKDETEDLKILVLPDINATGASIALAIANPIAGIGSFIAQLIFKDPLSKLFSFEYSVTGTWTHPVVKKLEHRTKF